MELVYVKCLFTSTHHILIQCHNQQAWLEVSHNLI